MKQSGDEEMQEIHMTGRLDVIIAKDYGVTESRPMRVCQNVTKRKV